MEQWVDEFCYDAHPEKEIIEWEHILDTFDRVGGKTLITIDQQELLLVLLHISMNTVDIESQTGLSPEKGRRLREAWAQGRG